MVGLASGLRLGMDIENNQRNKQREVYAAQDRNEDRSYNRKIRDYQLSNLQDQQNKKYLENSLNVMEAVEYLGAGLGDQVDQGAFIDSLNVVLDDEIGEGKRIKNLLPYKDGSVVVELEVDKDGKTYNAPLTKNRSSDPSDKVMRFQPDDLMNMVAGLEKSLLDAGHGGTLEERRKKAMDAIRIANGDKTPIVNQQASLKLKSDRDWEKEKIGLEHNNKLELAKLKSGKNGGSGSGSKRIQDSEYVFNHFKKPDGSRISREEAWKIANEAKFSAKEATIKVFNNLSEAQKNMALEPGDENYRTNEQLLEDSKQLVKSIGGMDFGEEGSEQEVSPEMDELFNDALGSN